MHIADYYDIIHTMVLYIQQKNTGPIRKPVEDRLSAYNKSLVAANNRLTRELQILRKQFQEYVEATDTILADHEARIATLETYH